MLAVPVARFAVLIVVAPFENVMVPVGMVALDVTVAVNVTGVANVEGLALDAMTVVVAAASTIWLRGVLALGRELVSPA